MISKIPLEMFCYVMFCYVILCYIIKRCGHGHWWNWHYDVTFDHTSWLFHVINYVSVTKRGCGCASDYRVKVS